MDTFQLWELNLDLILLASLVGQGGGGELNLDLILFCSRIGQGGEGELNLDLIRVGSRIGQGGKGPSLDRQGKGNSWGAPAILGELLGTLGILPW